MRIVVPAANCRQTAGTVLEKGSEFDLKAMHLFETIVDANHRALAGDASAGLHPDDFREPLPMVALTCIDARLNPLMPEVLGVPEQDFIWLRMPATSSVLSVLSRRRVQNQSVRHVFAPRPQIQV